MSRPAKFSDEIVSRAKAILLGSPNLAELRAAQAILLPARHGLSMEETAGMLGVSRSQVGAWQTRARTPRQPKRATHGGRRRQTMSLDEEKEFLAPWVEHASTAGMVIVPPLHEGLEKKLGRTIHHSQVYRMLARHGWRKVAPDTTHPKTDPIKQEDWKKNCRKWWPSTLPGPQQKGRRPV